MYEAEVLGLVRNTYVKKSTSSEVRTTYIALGAHI